MYKSTRKSTVKKMIKNTKKKKPSKPKRGQRTATNKRKSKK